jgi:hypothetical protein
MLTIGPYDYRWLVLPPIVCVMAVRHMPKADAYSVREGCWKKRRIERCERFIEQFGRSSRLWSKLHGRRP